MNVTHIMHQGPRAHPIINQGLLALGADITVSRDYISLGETIIKASNNIRQHANDSDLIFVGRRGDHESWLDKDELWGKVIWYDFEDFQTFDNDIVRKAAVYVKRSVVTQDRKLVKLEVGNKRILPIDYCILDEYLGYHAHRTYNIACLFGPNNRLGNRRKALMGHIRQANIPNSYIGSNCSTEQYGSHARNAISFSKSNNCFLEYMEILGQSKIVATAYPQKHDGDSRTWEAIASGAMVLLDTSYIPTTNPLIDSEHCLRFDASDNESITAAIDRARYYLENDAERLTIAKTGYEYAMRFHRPSNRLRYILSNFPHPLFV